MIRTALVVVLALGGVTWLVMLGAVLWVSRGVNRAISRTFGR